MQILLSFKNIWINSPLIDKKLTAIESSKIEYNSQNLHFLFWFDFAFHCIQGSIHLHICQQIIFFFPKRILEGMTDLRIPHPRHGSIFSTKSILLLFN